MKTYCLKSTSMVYVPNIFRFCQNLWKHDKVASQNIMRAFNLTDECITALMEGKIQTRIVGEDLVFDYEGEALMEYAA